MTMVTVYALFGDDIRILSVDKVFIILFFLNFKTLCYY